MEQMSRIRNRTAVLAGAVVWISALLSVAPNASVPAPGQGTAAVSAASPENQALVGKYCVSCHNQRTNAAGLALEGLNLSNVAEDHDRWEKVIRKLRTRQMPPVGMPRPDEPTYDRWVAALENALDAAAEAHPNPGRPLLHRMNRAEYANAVRDLLHLEVDTTPLLPPDDATHGFDNIADVLGVSPVLLERYLAAADRISALAVGDPETPPGSETFRARQDLSQNQHIPGLPLGTAGGLVARPTLPLDGEYVIQVKLMRTNTGAMRGLESVHQLEILVDDERVHTASFGGDADLRALYDNPTLAGDAIDARLRVRLALKAGPRTIGTAFVQKPMAASITRLRPFLRASDTIDTSGFPHVDLMAVTGPFNPTGVGDTPSRRRIFTCRPETPGTERRCARQILTTIGQRAFRHPLNSSEIDDLLRFFDSGRRSGGSFDAGIQMGLRRVLASPKFVFRHEPDPRGVRPGAPYQLGDLELASRLSFFLWSSIPDDELLKMATSGRLSNPIVVRQQVQRMLADPRATALVSNFAGQWLYLRNLRSTLPDSNVFPDFDDNLRQALRREVELFFDSIIREDRSVLDLLTADYTFVNERLARHYRIPGVYGDHFRRVTITDQARAGLLGKGAILTVTSQANRTSPVLRGKWVLENIVGTPPAPPPPDVPELPEVTTARPLTMRARMEAHRANAVCASCHRVMDPIGFALENFDAVGAWRERDGGFPIDASAPHWDGSTVDGVGGLRESLLNRPEVFLRTLTEKMLTYAIGRGLEPSDMPAVRAIVREAERDTYRFSSLVLALVNSTPFRMRVATDPTPSSAGSAPRKEVVLDVHQ
jgi:mono/diheme cytochrome c family protein